MSESGKCDVCQGPAQQRCGGCHSVFYCSKEHQKNAWKDHKKICKPYKVCEIYVIGRYLEAIKDIKEGDLILQEEPLMKGPMQITIPVCLGCGIAVTPENYTPCSQCGWPLCSQKCEDSVSHIPECYYTTKKKQKISFNEKHFGIPHPAYQAIIIMRCLYQKKFNPELWGKLIQLESHHGERKRSGKYDEDRATIVPFLQEYFELKEEFTIDEIMMMCGIVMVNGHEVPVTSPAHVAIYQEGSMLEHNCKANCYKTFSSKGKVVIVAGMPIKKGEHLTISYTDTLWSTISRRRHLMETKFFSCICDRCSDVTEFGTYFSAIKCHQKDCNGLMMPKTFLQEGIAWACKKCAIELTAEAVQKKLNRIGEDLSAMHKGSVEPCKEFLEYYGKMLSPKHFYMTDVTFALVQILGFALKTQDDVSNEDLQLMIDKCRELLDLVHILCPGEKRLRGSLLFELHTAVSERGRRQMTDGAIERQELLQIVLESREYLIQAIDCLKHEPSCAPEGLLYKQGKENMAHIEGLVYTLSSTLET